MLAAEPLAHPGDSPTEAELDRIQQAAFRYFLEQADKRTGLVYNTTEFRAPASPTACGAALTALPIGVERGWISRAQGYRMAKAILTTLSRVPHEQGFFYHFMDASSGQRVWNSEVSCIDSSILFAGALAAGAYFSGTAIEQLAEELIRRADWPWFMDREETLTWGWRPDTGFEGGPMNFSESILAYWLALGSSTHPIPASAWQALRRPISRYGDLPPMVYTPDGSLFAYLLPLAWVDVRQQHDAYLDYWTNARTAILANQQFCRDHRGQFTTYREGLWGISAALGPDGYLAYGAAPGMSRHDGTIAPYVIGAAMPWLPQEAIDAYRRLERLAPTLWTRYGFGNAVNLDRGYACPHTIALDQGLVLIMIENLRTGLIWNLMGRQPVIQRGLRAAGMTAGAQAAPTLQPAPGNPGAQMDIPMIDHAVTVDADLSEWIRHEAIELSPVRRRHIEFGFIRDSRDASAVMYAGWDGTMFYLAGIVIDDELVVGSSGSAIYRDDCLELFFDLDRNGFRFDRNPFDQQFGLSPGSPTGEQPQQVWAWGSLQRSPELPAAVRRGDGYFLFELGIPLALLGGHLPAAGTPVRFSVAYHDRDTDGKEAKLHWSVDNASEPGTLLFGTIRLMPSPSSDPQS